MRNYPGLPSFILEGFADGNYFIGRNKAVVDPFGVSVKNAMFLQGDYIRMHGLIQTMIMDMLKKAKVWTIREPQQMFHGLLPREYLRRYCEEQRTTKDFIIPDIMTQDHPCKQRNGRYVKLTRIYETQDLPVCTSMSIGTHGLTSGNMMMLTIYFDRIIMSITDTTMLTMILKFNVIIYPEDFNIKITSQRQKRYTQNTSKLIEIIINTVTHKQSSSPPSGSKILRRILRTHLHLNESFFQFWLFYSISLCICKAVKTKYIHNSILIISYWSNPGRSSILSIACPTFVKRYISLSTLRIFFKNFRLQNMQLSVF